MAYDPISKRVILFGGAEPRFAAPDIVFNDTWAWDGSNWTALAPSASPPARFGHAMVGAKDRVLLVGGRADDAPAALADAWSFDGSKWSSEAALPATSRVYSAMAFDSARGAVVLFGGMDPVSEDPIGDTWEWSGAWRQRLPTSAPGVNSVVGFAYDDARKLGVLVRAQDGAPATWELDGARAHWTLSPAVTPSLPGASVAYDSARGQTVLFGGGLKAPGNNVNYLQDTWTYDGQAWTKRAPAHAPEARAFAGMAFDSHAGVVRLFGGLGAGSFFDDSWAWDGNDWTQVTTSTAPEPRASAAFMYDRARDVIVLFGGETENGTVGGGDTWELDPKTGAWTKPLTPVTPGIRDGAAFVFDTVRGVGVLFGGRAADNSSADDTWEWSGSAWSTRAGGKASPEKDTFMVFDSARTRAVAYHGTSGETWEYVSIGEACAAGATCDTGHCVDGACCASASCGACASCGTGTCLPIASADDPDSCTGARTCDAHGQCKEKAGGACSAAADCASASCVGGICCDGTCAPFACGASGACLTSCARDADCVGGASCVQGACVMKSQCDGDHAVKSAAGVSTDCAPFRCSEGACIEACRTNDDCASGRVCDEAARCIVPPDPNGELAACAIGRGAARGAGSAPWIAGSALAALGWGARRSRRRIARERERDRDGDGAFGRGADA
jgi:hypothetical protein